MDASQNSTYTAEEIADTLLSMADERQARTMQRFFKTGSGEYGEGDRFLGLKNPQVRLVVKEAWKNTPLAEAVKLVESQLHELRLCGLLIMVEQYLRAMKLGQQTTGLRNEINASCDEIFDTYMGLHEHINNWDLVDLSAPKIVGNQEIKMMSNERGKTSPITHNYDLAPTLLDEWIKPGHTLWQQRIAMVSTWTLIRNGMPEVAFNRAALLLDSPHNLLHKAAGWMLRETWKHGYINELRKFLTDNVSRMPSVMLSYTCEKMSPDERHTWQQRRKHNKQQ